jgi:ankyrin repeat protein
LQNCHSFCPKKPAKQAPFLQAAVLGVMSLDKKMNDDWFEKEQLHFAAQDGDLNKIMELVEKGYSIDAFDEIDKTPLHYAVEEKHYEVVSYFIKLGADVNAYNESNAGNTPLGEVAANCSFKMAKILIDAGADPTLPGWMQITALDKAKERKKEEGKRVYQLLKEAVNKR